MGARGRWGVRCRLVLAGWLIVLAAAPGCARREVSTVRTERTIEPPSVVVEQETTTVTKTGTPQEPRGVLSTTVHVLGELLALPFRLVGGLIRLLF